MVLPVHPVLREITLQDWVWQEEFLHGEEVGERERVKASFPLSALKKPFKTMLCICPSFVKQDDTV